MASGALAVVAGALSVLAVAEPAAAEPTGTLYFDGLLATSTIGSPVQFRVLLTNDGPEQAVTLRMVIRITATGVEPQGVRIDRRELDGTWTTVVNKAGNRGDVKFVDDSYADQSVAAGEALAGNYRLTFLSGTPAGLAIVSANAQHRTDGTWQSLAKSPQYLTTVATSSAGYGANGGPGQASQPANGTPGSGPATRLPGGRQSQGTPGSPAATVGVPGGGGGQPGADPTASGGVVTDPGGTRTQAGSAAEVISPLAARPYTAVATGLVVILLVVVAILLRRQVDAGAGGGRRGGRPAGAGDGPGGGR